MSPLTNEKTHGDFWVGGGSGSQMLGVPFNERKTKTKLGDFLGGGWAGSEMLSVSFNENKQTNK